MFNDSAVTATLAVVTEAEGAAVAEVEEDELPDLVSPRTSTSPDVAETGVPEMRVTETDVLETRPLNENEAAASEDELPALTSGSDGGAISESDHIEYDEDEENEPDESVNSEYSESDNSEYELEEREAENRIPGRRNRGNWAADNFLSTLRQLEGLLLEIGGSWSSLEGEAEGEEGQEAEREGEEEEDGEEEEEEEGEGGWSDAEEDHVGGRARVPLFRMGVERLASGFNSGRGRRGRRGVRRGGVAGTGLRGGVTELEGREEREEREGMEGMVGREGGEAEEGGSGRANLQRAVPASSTSSSPAPAAAATAASSSSSSTSASTSASSVSLLSGSLSAEQAAEMARLEGAAPVFLRPFQEVEGATPAVQQGERERGERQREEWERGEAPGRESSEGEAFEREVHERQAREAEAQAFVAGPTEDRGAGLLRRLRAAQQQALLRLEVGLERRLQQLMQELVGPSVHVEFSLRRGRLVNADGSLAAGAGGVAGVGAGASGAGAGAGAGDAGADAGGGGGVGGLYGAGFGGGGAGGLAFGGAGFEARIHWGAGPAAAEPAGFAGAGGATTDSDGVTTTTIVFGNRGHFGNRGDYLDGPGLDAFLDQLVAADAQQRGNPPAALSAVDALPAVTVRLEDVESGVSCCAVCKEVAEVGEEVVRLPCRHLYHGGCIRQWLAVRNSCPICRFELPTDDGEYEERRQLREQEQTGRSQGVGEEAGRRQRVGSEAGQRQREGGEAGLWQGEGGADGWRGQEPQQQGLQERRRQREVQADGTFREQQRRQEQEQGREHEVEQQQEGEARVVGGDAEQASLGADSVRGSEQWQIGTTRVGVQLVGGGDGQRALVGADNPRGSTDRPHHGVARAGAQHVVGERSEELEGDGSGDQRRLEGGSEEGLRQSVEQDEGGDGVGNMSLHGRSEAVRGAGRGRGGRARRQGGHLLRLAGVVAAFALGRSVVRRIRRGEPGPWESSREE
ncbi:unnamed protein product [Closterium sp. NIES-54]